MIVLSSVVSLLWGPGLRFCIYVLVRSLTSLMSCQQFVSYLSYYCVFAVAK